MTLDPPVDPATAGAAGAVSDRVIAEVMLALLHRREAGASLCPSEVARAVAADGAAWRPLMPRVREVAHALAGAGRLRVLQRGAELRTPPPWRGPVRLASAEISAGAGSSAPIGPRRRGSARRIR